MRKSFFLFSLFIIFSATNSTKLRKNHFLAQSLVRIVQDFYVNRSESFDFIIFGNESESLSEIVDEVLKNVEYPTKVVKIKEFEGNRLIPVYDAKGNVEVSYTIQIDIKLNRSSIVLFKTESCLNYFLKNANLVKDQKNYHFFTYIEEKNYFFEILARRVVFFVLKLFF